MIQKAFKVAILSLIISLLPSNIQVANSNEILWNPGLGSSINSPSNLVPGAKIRTTGMLVYKSNPDELIMKIIMSDSFEQMPFSGKGRNLGMTIWLGKEGCYYSDRLDCERIQTIWAPNYPSDYPSSKSSEYVSVYNRDVKFTETPIASDCKAFWWIDSTYKNRDTWAFSLSITCLKIPKEFGTYGFSSIDLGQKDVAYDFSSPLNLTYPFHDLAAKAYKKPVDLTSINLLETKLNYIKNSFIPIKNVLRKSKSKDKKLMTRQIGQVEKQIKDNSDLFKKVRNAPAAENSLSILKSMNSVLNGTINQINALNRMLKIKPIKPDIIEYYGKLDKAVYKKGETARFWIEGKDLFGNAVTNGTPLGISDSDLVFNFSPNVFKISPLYSDLSNNGMWMYEFTINSEIGTHAITMKIGNNSEVKISYGVN
jgi:hypothetical protein